MPYSASAFFSHKRSRHIPAALRSQAGIPAALFHKTNPDFSRNDKKSADGIIIHGSAYTPSMSKVLMAEQFPHILIGSPGTNSRLCWIDTNNTLALGTMKAIEKAGLSIPSEIALLTFDIYPYSRIIEPKPAVVDIDDGRPLP